jgi:hypothetical protein
MQRSCLLAGTKAQAHIARVVVLMLTCMHFLASRHFIYV